MTVTEASPNLIFCSPTSRYDRATSRCSCCIPMLYLQRKRSDLDIPQALDHLFYSRGRLTCNRCGTMFPIRDGYLDLHPGHPEPVPPIQHLMQSTPVVAVYEGIWRPLGYFIASKHSFPKDVDRIASFMQRRHGLILDLACGPGNFTRRIARLAPDRRHRLRSFTGMLERAVRLTRKEGFETRTTCAEAHCHSVQARDVRRRNVLRRPAVVP